tara:strand:- start:370 stop:483 length:114 start_codon:yes stop_codon:yes gene_type:complete
MAFGCNVVRISFMELPMEKWFSVEASKKIKPRQRKAF